MTGTGVKVALVPPQIVVAGVDMVTEGTTEGFTVIVIVLDVTEAGDAQVAVEVITHETTCPLVREVVV